MSESLECLTCLHVVESFLARCSVKLSDRVEVASDVDGGGKVEHVLLTTARWQPQKTFETANRWSHVIRCI